MCDTMVALPNVTRGKKVLFAKNSDRQPDEPAEIVHVPRTTHSKGSEVQATYISIPQVRETAEILLCKPIWIFGGEMGANEYGVVIGNEAVFTKEKYNKKGGLIGMDLLRFALERGKSARAALEVIIDLLELYGQGGNCGYRKKEFYHNSFLIADKQEAWVLETADRFWIAEQVKDIRTISNTITIRGEGDIHHPELVEHAVEKGWCKDPEKFDFYTHYVAKRQIEQIVAKGNARCKRSSYLLQQKKKEIDAAYMMQVLRDHQPVKTNWTPAKDASFHSLCVHAKNFLNPSQTTISMVSEVGEKLQIHWITGTSSPCTSIFKPFFMPRAVPAIEPKTTAFYEAKNLWWQHEKLHRLVLLDYQNRLASYKKERDALEKQFIEETESFLKQNPTPVELKEFSRQKILQAMKKEDEWIEKVQEVPVSHYLNPFYKRFWAKRNKWNRLSLQN